jgi:dienelactone hydrolase
VLTKQGFVVLMVDSFTPRGVKNMCEPAKFDERVYTARPFDSLAALQFLQKQSFVDPSRIGIMGWSEGGGAVLDDVSDDALRSNNGFKAAVAFYPSRCNSMMIGEEWSTTIPLLVLVGGKDNWTPASACISALQKRPEVDVKLYPSAYHDFDWPNDRIHQLPLYQTSAGVIPIAGEDPSARADALRIVPQFLQRNLGG